MTTHFDGCECWYCHHGVNPPPTYNGHPLSYWYGEYTRQCEGTPLPLAEWVHDPAHSPQFRQSFGLSIRQSSDTLINHQPKGTP